MILDNTNDNLKVHEWISDYTKEGKMSIVTGYFTIGALVYLSKSTNEIIDKFNLIIGDIVSTSDTKIKALDLLNENLSIENASRLKTIAEQAVYFLKLDKVEVKTLEPNFCHAKLIVNKIGEKYHRDEYFIMGSSNLTEAGLGLKQNHNVELNIAGQSSDPRHLQLYEWFESLWENKKAHFDKTIEDENGNKKRVNFKQYLIDEISKIFNIYTPLEIYEKILFELFQSNNDDEVFQRNFGKLENTIVFKELYPFQKVGARNLIKMLDKYNGAILADAVGLGKTWTTLAVIKYFEYKGIDTILLCPKRLEHNWLQYQKRENSIFEFDQFDYKINFHTDFTENNLESNKLKLDYLLNSKPKLIVIDESHNLRNDKSIKYRILVDEILKKTNGDIKVLLLSATPINNSFKDVRNQFLLMCKGENHGFDELLGVRNMDSTFRIIQAKYNEWTKSENAKVGEFYKLINDSDFFKLTENIVVARTRKAIKQHFDKDFKFPTHKDVININKTPLEFKDVEDFTQLMESLQLNLSAYQPTQFTLSKQEVKQYEQDKNRDVTKDEFQREYFLVKMMKILLLKRLESSWYSFYTTLCKIYAHHESLLDNINEYQQKKKAIAQFDFSDFDDDFESDLDDYVIGKKEISISEIDSVGRLEEYKKYLKNDKKSLGHIKSNIDDFIKEFNKDYRKDIKLVELISIIEKKQKSRNPKLIIFTTYADTASYLYEQLVKLKFNGIGLVSGSKGKFITKSGIETPTSNIEFILQHFAPYTKLFKEKKWDEFILEKNLENYTIWRKFIIDAKPIYKSIIDNELDILVTTDVLSEGQNLQDADMVINYDVHWNPVRIIQRFGRIDRIGSPNKEIQLVNFWPAIDIDAYIKLKKRVETRMSVMQFMGSEVVSNITPEFMDNNSDSLEERQTEILLRQMQNSIEDLDADKSLGFDDFSFDNYRQELSEILHSKKNELSSLPHGIFSGFKIPASDSFKPGIIALLGLKPKLDNQYRAYELVYIDDNQSLTSNNQKLILEFLAINKSKARYIDPKIDAGDESFILKFQTNILYWIDSLTNKSIENEDGSLSIVAGSASIEMLNKIKSGDKKTISQATQGNTANSIYSRENFDLITWLIISN